MPYQGHFVEGLERFALLLNTRSLQKGATSGFPVQYTGMIVWDDSTQMVYVSDGASFGLIIQVDAAAAVGSLRTLGTGQFQIAAGNHAHSL